jgi:hypothetical protein
LDETPKAISPFGGLASFISFLGQIGFARQVQQHLPFAEPTSNVSVLVSPSGQEGIGQAKLGDVRILWSGLFSKRRESVLPRG